MKKSIKFAVIALMIACVVNACTKHTPYPGSVSNYTTVIDSNRIRVVPTNNLLPIADAGSDQIITVSMGSFTLNGNGIDADGRIVRYEWNIVAFKAQIGEYEYFDYHTPSVTISDISEGTYNCTLTVTDDMGSSASDEVIIQVRPQ
jgi:K319L-like, PKD domain